MNFPKLSGLIAAPFTPFKDNGEIAYDLIARQAENLIADGVSGAYVCGSTGEGISCTVNERIQVMEAWAAAAKGKLTLIAHVGALSMADVKTLTAEAVKFGYDAFSAIPPTFFRTETERSLVDYCKEIAGFAPELPFYYYHTMNARLNLTMCKFLQLADGVIPNLGGVKFYNYNLYDYQNSLNYKNGKYDVVFGVDEVFPAALTLGAKCFIGSTYNYSSELYFRIWEAFDKHDLDTVQKLMRKVCAGVDILGEYGGIPAGKAMMLLKGIDCGIARSPLRKLDAAVRQDIADRMQKILQD